MLTTILCAPRYAVLVVNAQEKIEAFTHIEHHVAESSEDNEKNEKNDKDDNSDEDIHVSLMSLIMLFVLFFSFKFQLCLEELFLRNFVKFLSLPAIFAM